MKQRKESLKKNAPHANGFSEVPMFRDGIQLEASDQIRCEWMLHLQTVRNFILYFCLV